MNLSRFDPPQLESERDWNHMILELNKIKLMVKKNMVKLLKLHVHDNIMLEETQQALCTKI
jgi:hypothetical protein